MPRSNLTRGDLGKPVALDLSDTNSTSSAAHSALSDKQKLAGCWPGAERRESARPARCRASRRRSLDRTHSGRSGTSAETGLHAPFQTLTDAAPYGSVWRWDNL